MHRTAKKKRISGQTSSPEIGMVSPLDKLNKFRFLRVLLAIKNEFTGKQDDDPVGGA
jgi:hypothetical protein